MHNVAEKNSGLSLSTHRIAQWHIERNLIEGATSWSQTEKLLEEFTELVAAQLARKNKESPSPEHVYNETLSMLNSLFERGRIKGCNPESAEENMRDSIGDMYVVQTNIVEREQWTMKQCIDASYDEIKHRTGRMINGTFVKEEDLPENQ